MKNVLKAFGIIAFVAVIGFSMAACDNGGDGDIPPALVGVWTTQAGDPAFEITSAGLFFTAGQSFDISVSGNMVTLKTGGTTVGTFNYAINNNAMTITNGTGIGMSVALLSPVVKIGISNPGGGIPPALVGVWTTQAGDPAFEITSAGLFSFADQLFDISLSGKTVMLKQGGTTVGAFDYAINNNVMTITNGMMVGQSVALLSPVVKSSDGGDQPNIPGGEVNSATFNSIAEFRTWLADQPLHQAYNVKLNVSALGGDSDTAGSLGKTLQENSDRSVNLDLSGSTFTSIEDKAFYECRSLSSIIIPNSVTSIGDLAFSFCSFPSITIPDSVTSIGSGAFDYSRLNSVTIGSGVTSIGRGAFADCYNLTNITIPNNVTSIGEWAFMGCESLTSVTIGNGVNSIESQVFAYCDSLTSVTIGSGVTSIDDNAFQDCDSLNNITWYYNTALSLPTNFRSYVKTVIIPDSVTSIGYGAFTGCTSLTSITIPNSVTGIEANAFNSCANLTNVTIGSNVASIGTYAFSGCYSLKSITIPNSVIIIDQGVFYQCTGLTSITIPNSVTTIKNYAFNGCEKLTSVTLPTNVNFTTIAASTFAGCTGLVSITIPSNVTTIGESAFSGSTGLNIVIFSTGSNISNANFGTNAFPEGSNGAGGNSLKTAYNSGKAGTYKRSSDGSTWTKQ